MSASTSRFSKKSQLIAGLAVVLVGGGTAAYAFWTSFGGGTGDVGTSTGIAAAVPKGDVTALLIAPPVANGAGPATALTGSFTNPSSTALTIKWVEAQVDSVTPSALYSSTLPCTIADYAVTQPTQIGSALGAAGAVPATAGSPGSISIPATTNTAWGYFGGGTINIVASSFNQDSCKGATVTVKYLAH